MRLLAEGKIKWAFWPPEYDASQIPDAKAGYGIWVPSGVEGPDPDLDNNEESSDDYDGDGDDPETEEESSGSTTSGVSYQTRTPSKGFELLSLLDNH